ncbi:hypothetical protein [Sinorhizobium meliloti]|uniref:hypothetical protein n=1 Tax=Rhizobium meliloti TaxID=382 RepID=UPI00299E4000|nr:hypothetical protein [Sinorhizobium meliloti]MDW9991050.1 hypothetical protein [Sinorhizobium meliloti]MDX0245450.1 hypothetical protein [Sinorhizobium meliloti]MDX0401546.1 hypothetical protein [Sinorhizobium meliloti]
MAVIDVPFTSFTPDLPAHGNPGLVKAHNCSPGLGSSGQGSVTLFPLKSASLYSNTSMVSRPLGSAIGQDRDGNAKVYSACATTLYKLLPSTRQWTDVSRVGGYSTTNTESWRFVEFGSLQIGTNYNNEPQFVDMNVDLQFANLTTLVKGRYINTHKGFVILGNTWDAIDGGIPYRVRWSGIEAPSDWTFSAATMADFQDIHGFGAIQGIVTDDSCYVILQRGIVQMSFVGGSFVFQFTDRVVGKGCSIAQSIITVEGKHFFLSDDGFYKLEQGNLTPIGIGKINEWFLDTADLTQAHLMTVAADPRRTLIYWQFVSKDAVTGTPDKQLIFNYVTGEWTTADATTAFIFNSVSLPWTLDQLDAFGTLDSVPSSFDSPIWSGGNSMLWGMSATGAVYSFGGPTMELSIETPEFQLSRNVPNESGADTAIVNAVRPRFEGGEGIARIQVGTRKLPNEDVAWSSMKECNSETGFAYVRKRSRYQRFRVNISGEWSKAYSLEIDAQPAGKR